jgi:penicillin-binding protein 2
VVLAVKTGEILACANNKSFDPSWFINKDEESQAKMLEALNDDINFPMYNRALSATYTPGSIIKPLIAISALESGSINKETKLECKMKVEIGGKLFTCLGWHGSIDVSTAIEQSCNIFFNLLGVQTGIDTINTWAKAYGLGTVTGVDLPGESSVILSNPEYKLMRDNLPWHIADTAQSAIGQMYYNFTPMQIVNYTAILASGGDKHTPHVILKIIDTDDEVIYEGDISYTDVGISDETDMIIREAMIRVAKNGTASRVFEDYPIAVAAKTGTAETGYEENSSSNGLSIAYAPADDPEIAVCVVIEHGVWGSYTVPAIMRIFNAYFNIELEQEIVDDTIVTNEQ